MMKIALIKLGSRVCVKNAMSSTVEEVLATTKLLKHHFVTIYTKKLKSDPATTYDIRDLK